MICDCEKYEKYDDVAEHLKLVHARLRKAKRWRTFFVWWAALLSWENVLDFLIDSSIISLEIGLVLAGLGFTFFIALLLWVSTSAAGRYGGD